MYISISTIFAFSIIGLLFLLPYLEKKGLFLNKKVSPYYSRLAHIVKNELQIESKNILETAQQHLSSEYRSYKNAVSPLVYTTDLINNHNNHIAKTCWAYIFIINFFQKSSFLQNSDTQKLKHPIIEICKKQIENKDYPASFKEYFNL